MLKFGVFDHLDSDGQPLGALLESLMRMIETIERAG